MFPLQIAVTIAMVDKEHHWKDRVPFDYKYSATRPPEQNLLKPSEWFPVVLWKKKTVLVVPLMLYDNPDQPFANT